MSTSLAHLHTLLDSFPPHTPFALPLSLLNYSLIHQYTHHFANYSQNDKVFLDNDGCAAEVTIYLIQCPHCNRRHFFNDRENEKADDLDFGTSPLSNTENDACSKAKNLFAPSSSHLLQDINAPLMNHLLQKFPHESGCLSHATQRLNFNEYESFWFSVSGMLRNGNDPTTCLAFLMRENVSLLRQVMHRNETNPLDEMHHLQEQQEDAEQLRQEFENVQRGELQDAEEDAEIADNENATMDVLVDLELTDAAASPPRNTPMPPPVTVTNQPPTLAQTQTLPSTPIEAHAFPHIVQKLIDLCLSAVDTTNFDTFLERLFKLRVESNYFPSLLDLPHKKLLFIISLFGWREPALPTPVQKQLKILNCHFCATRMRMTLICGEFPSYAFFNSHNIENLTQQLMENHRWWCPMTRQVSLALSCKERAGLGASCGTLGWQQVYNHARCRTSLFADEESLSASSAVPPQLASNLYYKYVTEAMNILNERVSHITKYKKHIKGLARKEEIASQRASEVANQMRENVGLQEVEVEGELADARDDRMEDVDGGISEQQEVRTVVAPEGAEKGAETDEQPPTPTPVAAEEEAEEVPALLTSIQPEEAQQQPDHLQTRVVQQTEDTVTPLIVETPFFGRVPEAGSSQAVESLIIPATPAATPTHTSPLSSRELTVTTTARSATSPSTPERSSADDTSTTSSPLSPLPSPKNSDRIVKSTKTKRLMRPSFKRATQGDES